MSSEGSYDSEEEARRARLTQAARARRLRDQAAAEQDLLRAYREHQRRTELPGAGVPSWSSAQGWAREAQGAGACTGPAAQPGSQLREHIARYARQRLVCVCVFIAVQPFLPRMALSRRAPAPRRWERLTAEEPTSAPLTYESIPWPPCGASEYLQGLAEELPDGSARPLRRAYATACLWWHPDKFAQRHQARFESPAELERALARVQSLFQELSAAWAARGPADA